VNLKGLKSSFWLNGSNQGENHVWLEDDHDLHGIVHIDPARIMCDHPLIENLSTLRLLPKNGLPIRPQEGNSLAEIQEHTELDLEDDGGPGGDVLVLSDLGSLDLSDFQHHETDNLKFFGNLTCYALHR